MTSSRNQKTAEEAAAAKAAKAASDDKLRAGFLARHARRRACFAGGRLFAQLEIEEAVELCRIAGPLGLAVFDALAKIAGPLRCSGDALEGSAAPTQGELAALVGIDRKTLQAKLALLEAGGRLRVEGRRGAKPTWWVHPRPGPVKLGSGSATSADETEALDTATKRTSSTTKRTSSTTKRTQAAPAPPQRREGREREEVGDGELRKIGREKRSEELELEVLVHRFSNSMCALLAEDPDSQTHQALEELVDEARDVHAWRLLVEQAEGALACSPHLAEPDA